MTLQPIMNGSGAVGHSAASTVTLGVFVVESTPSVKVFAPSVGPGVHTTPLEYSFTGGNAPGMVPGTVHTVVNQFIPATAVKVTAEGVSVMRLGDSAIMTAEGEATGSGTPTPVTGPVEIVDAGQTKALAQ